METKRTSRFSQRKSRHSLKNLRRSSSFVKDLPRKSLRQNQNEGTGAGTGASAGTGAGAGPQHVWIEDNQGDWILCQKIRQENTTLLLRNVTTNQVFSWDLAFKEVFYHDPNVSADMITLRGLSEPTILHNLRERSLAKNPYTYMGTVLISVNPFEWYEFPEINDFKGKILDPSRPHPYAIAEYAYQQICSTHAHDHAVVISGESGAGKTESAHMVLSFIVNRASGSSSLESHLDSIEERLLKSSPILEAFGNAKTSRNSNSSRFGKYMKIYFRPTEIISSGEKQRRISHASVETYLLEKSRVTSQIDGEENFHVFYVLLAALDSQESFVGPVRLSSNQPSQFSILSNATTQVSNPTKTSKGLLRQSSFAHGSTLLDQYHAVSGAMETLGYSSDKILSIWKTIGAILELGNIQFVNLDTNEGQISHIDNTGHVNLAAELIGVNTEDLIILLTKRTVTTVGEKITKSLTSEESIKAKNAFVKALYANLFTVLVNSINLSLTQTTSGKNESLTSIGILDIFGFESFERNEFEQLLINYANESLQNTFNEQIFQNELRLYQEESVKVNISLEECPSNSACVNLIYSRAPNNSVISILHSVAQSPKASDEMFCENLHKMFSTDRNPITRRYFPTVHPKDRKVLFSINHFAGTVTYNVGERGQNTWLNKNHDTIPEDMFPLLSSSTNDFIRSLLNIGTNNTSGKQRKQSVADSFSQSMSELCQTLKQSNCSFIRCIKPNKSSLPSNYDPRYVVPQIRALGLVQVCEVMKVGLTNRISFEELKKMHSEIAAEIQRQFPEESNEVVVAVLLWALKVPDESYYIGKTRVFFKSDAGEVFDRLLDIKTSVTAEVVQQIEQAKQVRISTKGIIENLERNAALLMVQFTQNQQSIQKIVDTITTTDVLFTSLTKENRIIASVIPKIVKKLSATETTVQDAKNNVEDLKSSPEFNHIQELFTTVESQLNSCDDIWVNIDTKSSTLTEYLSTQPIDLLRNSRAEVSNELSAIESLFPDVHYLIKKTVEEANRCQLSKLERRATDCEYNINLVKSRLESNADEIQSAHGTANDIRTDLETKTALARELSALQQQVMLVAENISKLCLDIRTKSTQLRLKIIRDEQERIRIENEASEREERLRLERLKQEEEAQRIQEEEDAVEAATELEELKRLEEMNLDVSSFRSDGLELPSGWEWNNEKQLYYNRLTRSYQVDVPTMPAMSHSDTGLDESYLETSNKSEVTEYDFDGIRVYTFVDATEVSESEVIVETVFDSEKILSDDQPTNQKVVKELSFMYDGIRVYTTKEITEMEKISEKNEELDDEKDENLQAAKNISITMELHEKIGRVFKKGYLQKQGKYFGSWRRLYFVLNGNSLAHYSDKRSYQCGALPTKIIQLTGLSVLSYTRFNLCFTVHTGGRTSWTMMAEDKKEFQQWMELLNNVIGALFDTRIQSK